MSCNCANLRGGRWGHCASEEAAKLAGCPWPWAMLMVPNQALHAVQTSPDAPLSPHRLLQLFLKARMGANSPILMCFLQNWERNPAAITDFSPTRKSLPAFMSICHTGEKHHRCPLILELMCCASRSHGKMCALQLNPTEMGRIKGDHASGGLYLGILRFSIKTPLRKGCTQAPITRGKATRE